MSCLTLDGRGNQFFHARLNASCLTRAIGSLKSGHFVPTLPGAAAAREVASRAAQRAVQPAAATGEGANERLHDAEAARRLRWAVDFAIGRTTIFWTSLN